MLSASSASQPFAASEKKWHRSSRIVSRLPGCYVTWENLLHLISDQLIPFFCWNFRRCEFFEGHHSQLFLGQQCILSVTVHWLRYNKPHAFAPSLRSQSLNYSASKLKNLFMLSARISSYGLPYFPCCHTFSLFVPLLINLLTTYRRHQFPPDKKKDTKNKTYKRRQ